jgi:c-di-GMP phosphodiesterase
MNAISDSLLVRAPVLNRSLEIVGYDLRLSASGVDALSGHGLLQLLTGDSEQENFFLRLPNRFALTGSGQVDADKPAAPAIGRVVVEMDPATQPGDALTPQARKWKAAGYGICLQRPYSTPVSSETLDLASHFTVDGAELELELEKTCNRLRRHSAKQIAIGVETPGLFNATHRAGCDLFRGYFVTQPSREQARAIAPNYATIVTLMQLAQENAPVAKIEQALKRDATLSYKLLRYINSAGFGLSCEIQSFRHAVAVLGYQNLYRWLALLLVTAARKSSSSALVTLAITRGRLAELIGEDSFDPQERDNLFIVGAFSLLDVILKMPLEAVLEHIPLTENIRDALLRREGPYGSILSVVAATEAFDQPQSRAQALQLADLLGMAAQQLNRAQLDALAWAEGLGD